MWKPIVCIFFLASSWSQVSANGEGWGWGSGQQNQQQQQPSNQAQPSNGNYWWMSSNPFQKPPNHPGIEKGDESAGSYAKPQPSNQQIPSYGGNQQSSSIAFQPSGPQNTYNQPQVQPPQYQPAPAPPSIGGGSYGIAPVKPQVQPIQVPSSPSYGGGPSPVKPQVQVQPFPAPSGPSVSYGPAPVKPQVPVQVPSYGNPAPAPPQQNNYGVPKPQPVPVAPTYGNSGQGWSAPPSSPQISQPNQQYNLPSIDFDECKLTNKADCHKGAQPNPSYNQVEYNRPPSAPAPSTNYAPPPPQNYAPPPPSNYAPPQPAKYANPPPLVKPQYQQQISPQPLPAPQPPKPTYNNNPSQGYQQPPQNNYQNQPQPSYNGGNAVTNYAEQPPYPGCPAAMLCTPDNQCDSEGKISQTPLQLSEAEKIYRVALSTCSSPSTGIVGVCCRDPNYKDPWPDMNGGGGGGGGNHQHHHDGGNNGGHSQPSYQQQSSSNSNSYAGR